MGAAVLVPLEEYLRTTYRPDRDYVDGELLERNVGEQQHAFLQALLAGVFNSNEGWGLCGLTESRVQVAESRFRLPDVCVVRESDPMDPIIRRPPQLCIEILSKDDTLSSLQDRIDDYLRMGVAAVWVVDPAKRRGFEVTASDFRQVSTGVLSIPGTEIKVDLRKIFERLDRRPRAS
jgi:Uma2 family endonuclease